MTKYLEVCEGYCFGAWGNTPGYYLLTKIDYNKYLKQILPNITNTIDNIDGIYVDRDQDEIILFNNANINKIYSIHYILPYFYKDKSLQEIKQFIINFIDKSTIYLKDNTNLENNQQLLEILSAFNFIDSAKKEKWNFDWFRTFCKDFDPYKEIDENNCGNYSELKNEPYCTTRYPNNFKNLGEADEDFNWSLCTKSVVTSKISILDIKKNSDNLQKWIKMILSPRFTNDSIQLFTWICRNNAVNTDRILHIL